MNQPITDIFCGEISGHENQNTHMEPRVTCTLTSVLVVDNCPIFVNGLESLLKSNGYAMVESVTSIEALQDNDLTNLLSNLLLFIIGPHLPTPKGFAACRWATQHGLRRIIFISADLDNPVFIADAKILGVGASLPTGVSPEQLLQTLLTLSIIKPPFAHAGDVGSFRLSVRELDVLKLWADGKTDKEVAEKLHVEISTARTHAQRILMRLNVHSRRDAIHRALHHGLI